MLITTPTQSIENLLLDIAENAKVGRETSSPNRLAKNSSVWVDIAEDNKVGESDGNDYKIVERLSFKKLSGPTRYLISLYSKKR